MRKYLTVPTMALLAPLTAAQAWAQPIMAEQKFVTATGARALVDSCLAYAKKNNLRVGVAVVDISGNLLDYHTMEGTDLIAGESAILKAKTAVRWQQPTDDLNRRVKNKDNIAPALIGDFPQEGGVPIFMDGVIVGGMGIGGGRGDACAKAAIASVLPAAVTTPPRAP